MLSLYFNIGGYISRNSRKGFWGTNAIEVIATQLQKELPGLRGFSATNMRYMRLFFEGWTNQDISSVITDDFQSVENEEIAIHPLVMDEIRQLQLANLHNENISAVTTAELSAENFELFLKVGFTHHCEIIAKTKSLEERLFYIQKCATEFWTVEKLKYNLKSN
jgi:predicted nuclease of restriction endonuclease-like (RecB) superfamily